MKNKIVSREEWLASRAVLLAKEKELTRLRDEVSRQRRETPWVKLDKEYRFEGAGGSESLAELFAGKSQLLVYHFMFDPSWTEGCKSCSFWADSFDGVVAHIEQRDVSLVVISRAALPTLAAFQKRMGWRFKWLSSLGNDFNRDYHVSFGAEDRTNDKVYYNYTLTTFPSSEAPGVSVFYKDEAGDVFHTYSCYARGLDALNGGYQLIDLLPKGRDEAHLAYGMGWLKHHDKY